MGLVSNACRRLVILNVLISVTLEKNQPSGCLETACSHVYIFVDIQKTYLPEQSLGPCGVGSECLKLLKSNGLSLAHLDTE